jgi:hypothetical protein
MLRFDEWSLIRSGKRGVRWMHVLWLLPILGTFLLSSNLSAQATAVSSPCEAALVKPATDPLAYGLRGERCEGVYVREVAGTGGFAVVAFIASRSVPAIERGKPLVLEWPTGLDTPILLRAVSLRRKLYYRMDARRPTGSPRFEWPTDVLTDLKLTIDELGIVAWTEGRIGENTQDIYVPLSVAGAAATASQQPYVLQVVSGTDLQDVFVRLANVDASGREQKVVVRDESLKRGFYPAERAIPIRLPVLSTVGLYRLQLNAVLTNGRPSSRTLYFRHIGR